MTGSVTPAIPTVGDPNSTEDADTRSGLITLRDALNAVLTPANLLDGAQIAAGSVPSAAYADNTLALAKLVNQAAGKVLIANASGVVTGTTLTGDVTVTSGGVTAIGADKVTAAMIAAGAVGASEIADGTVSTTELAANAATVLHLDTDGADVVGITTTTKVAETLTLPTAGNACVYLANVELQHSLTTGNAILIAKQGGTTLATRTQRAPATATTSFTATVIQPFTANGSGPELDLNTASGTLTVVSGSLCVVELKR